jgi:hypothetical protein
MSHCLTCVYLCEKQTARRPLIAPLRTRISPSTGAVVPGARDGFTAHALAC